MAKLARTAARIHTWESTQDQILDNHLEWRYTATCSRSNAKRLCRLHALEHVDDGTLRSILCNAYV